MLGLRFKFRAVALKTLLFVSTGLIVIGFAPSGVSGATGDEFSIIASVQNQTLVDGSTSRTPVEGVTINVLKADGTPIGEAVTGKDGLCTISVPSRDDYVIELNLSTLPDGLTLIDAEKQKVAVNRDLFTTNTKRVTFFTGESANAGASASERVLQRLSDGIRLGLIIAMCSVGLSLVFGTTGLTNFAHGEMVTFGGLIAFYFNVILEIPILISGPVVILMGGLFGLLLNWGIFARLTKRGVTLLSQLVVTVGLSLMLRNIYLFQFGGRTKQLSSYS